MLIGIGSRLELQWLRWPDQPAGLKIVNIDIDPEQGERLKPDIATVEDARACAAELNKALGRAAVGRRSRQPEFQAIKDETLAAA